jgi:hypothetical protein
MTIEADRIDVTNLSEKLVERLERDMKRMLVLSLQLYCAGHNDAPSTEILRRTSREVG